MKFKIDKILREHFKVQYFGYNRFVWITEDDFEQANKEIMKLIETERMNVAGAVHEAADDEEIKTEKDLSKWMQDEIIKELALRYSRFLLDAIDRESIRPEMGNTSYAQGHIDAVRKVKEMVAYATPEVLNDYREQINGLKVSYDEWRKSIDRIRELKSIIKQARANCFSNKPHKTIMEILDKGI